jgi:uncharacterized protein YqgV (UPF0045/DUF77 family)
MITAEAAIYPLKTNDATGVINSSIDTLRDSSVDYSVNSMNTKLTGSTDNVFDSLKEMFVKADANGGEVSMVVTITNSAS